MKKVLVTIIMSCMCLNAYSATVNMCVRNNSFVGVLKKSINGGSPAYDNPDKSWRVTFDYSSVDGNATKYISGYGACSTTAGTVNSPNYTIKLTSASTGTYCWCKMAPVPEYGIYAQISSYWVRQSSFSASSSCSSGCALNCAQAVANDTNGFRTALFNSVFR